MVPQVSSFLEEAFPFEDVSILASRARRAPDAAYTAHRWWARRPAATFRAAMIAAALPADSQSHAFWDIFNSTRPALAGLTVYDPFMGGGTTLVEGMRLGARVYGTDVDPLSVSIVRRALGAADTQALESAAQGLLEHLSDLSVGLYPSPDQQTEPLHYFYLFRVTCPSCKQQTELHSSTVIARDVGKHGGVRREAAISSFCPTCLRVHHLADPSAESFDCCGPILLASGNYRNGKFTCPSCRVVSNHAQLRTGAAPRVLLAVEETGNGRRLIRSPSEVDYHALDVAEHAFDKSESRLVYPRHALAKDRIDRRPVSFGMETFASLFTRRQLLLFGEAFGWVSRAEVQPDVRDALRLILSNALTSNNLLCSYATDYGRLAPLFSVRSYSLPSLSVEANPLHARSGRGNLRRSLTDKLRTPRWRRWSWDPDAKEATGTLEQVPLTGEVGALYLASSADVNLPEPIDLCVFDPPYFDYIAYSELSEFYRAWLPTHELGGEPLFGAGPAATSGFGRELGQCLNRATETLRAGGIAMFTFHSRHEDAWDALGMALDRARLRVTALWPVRNDSEMGHHAGDGNCEWDVLVVCRKQSDVHTPPSFSAAVKWSASFDSVAANTADRLSFGFAVSMAVSRSV